VLNSECGERWPTRSIRLGEAAVGWLSLTETPHRNAGGEFGQLQDRVRPQGVAMDSSPEPWPDRQGTGRAAFASVACSAFALAGMLDPMGEEARVQGRTMGAEVPIPPRSSQTSQLHTVLIPGPWGDPIRPGSSQTFHPPRLGEALRWELSCCLLWLAMAISLILSSSSLCCPSHSSVTKKISGAGIESTFELEVEEQRSVRVPPSKHHQIAQHRKLR